MKPTEDVLNVVAKKFEKDEAMQMLLESFRRIKHHMNEDTAIAFLFGEISLSRKYILRLQSELDYNNAYIENLERLLGDKGAVHLGRSKTT